MQFWREFRFDSPTESPEGDWRDYLREVPCKRCGQWALKYSLWWTKDEMQMTEAFSHYHSKDRKWYFHRMATDLRQSSAVAEQKSQLEEQGESPDDAVEDRGESQDTAWRHIRPLQ